MEQATLNAYAVLAVLGRKEDDISEREMIRVIHRISEEAKVGHIMESDEQLMRYSAKHLYAIFMHLYDKLKRGACHA